MRDFALSALGITTIILILIILGLWQVIKARGEGMEG